MWVRTNPNPKHKHVPDCVIRALAIVLNKTWYQVYDDLYMDPGMSGHWPGPPPMWSGSYKGYPPDNYYWR